jgi:hypothetical protein
MRQEMQALFATTTNDYNDIMRIMSAKRKAMRKNELEGREIEDLINEAFFEYNKDTYGRAIKHRLLDTVDGKNFVLIFAYDEWNLDQLERAAQEQADAVTTN